MAPATPLKSPAASANACPRIATRRLARKSTRVRWRAELTSTSLCCPDLTSLHLIPSAVEQKRREKTKELVVELQELLPNLNGSNSPNCTMNTVLQRCEG